MKSNKDTALKIDEIGEMLNISMSSASTAVAGILEKDVEISTLNVDFSSCSSANFESYEPAICAEYEFIKGLLGKSIVLFKEQDMKKIVSIILQRDFTDEEFELDEVNVSAISEVLSQMMSSCFSALINFVGKDIAATEPVPFEAVDTNIIKNNYYSENTNIVSVQFRLVIAGVLDSEFVLLLDEAQAGELIVNVSTGAVAQQPVQTTSQVTVQEPTQAKPQEATYSQPPASYESSYDVRPVELRRYGENDNHSNEEQATNLNMIMSVPLQISVEIGRTKKQIKDILELTTGSIVDLNKQAGSQVDVFVNGQLIASGEVVVVEDHYGVRISEILNSGEIMKII